MMRYVMSTIDLRLRFGPTGSLELVYSDADYATDKPDRKSISGSVGLLGGAAIFWLSRKQKSVSTSTTEAEYVAMSVTAEQDQWISQILRDMGYPNYVAKNGFTIETRADNQGAIALVKNLHLHERSKHIAVPYHYVRDLHERNHIHTEYVPTKEMVADGLTNPLGRLSFQRFVEMMGLENSRSLCGIFPTDRNLVCPDSKVGVLKLQSYEG
ncbi:hypothetical protein K3495_g2814 [Podosphaera aphanis]|nr:hypothetical protein K3495_g2814 [Podosphaera aphanis]